MEPNHQLRTGRPAVLPVPPVRHISVLPAWMANDPAAGEVLLSRTAEQQLVGRDDPEFRGVDPLRPFTNWFGSGVGSVKPFFDPTPDGFDARRIRVFRPSHGSRRLPVVKPAKGHAPIVAYSTDGSSTKSCRLDEFDFERLRTAFPTREFFRRLEQPNKPVAAWLYTTGHHVNAESHHERTLMTLGDHHPAVHHIAGQPFTLVWPDGSPIKSHTPDVAFTGTGTPPLIVDVKTPKESRKPAWVERAPLVAEAIARMGMGYVVWTGMSRPFRLNMENFTNARVPEASYKRWSDVAVQLCSAPMTASELADRLDEAGYQRGWALTLIRRLLWRRRLHTDMFAVYDSRSIVERGDV